MRVVVLRLLFLLSVCAQVAGRVEADPVPALSNLPNPLTSGGSVLDDQNWKANVFTTPASASAQVVSIEAALNCRTCSSGASHYPSVAQIQFSIYSTRSNVPDQLLYASDIQTTTLTATGQTISFTIPNWSLAANTTYALMAKSTAADPVKLANARTGGDAGLPQDDIQISALNGFTYVAAYTSGDAGNSYIFTTATNNALVMNVLLIPSVPTLSEWSQMLLGLLVLSMICWHFHKQRSY